MSASRVVVRKKAAAMVGCRRAGPEPWLLPVPWLVCVSCTLLRGYVVELCGHLGLSRMLAKIGVEAVDKHRLGCLEFVCPRCGGKVQLEVYRRRQGEAIVWGFRLYDLVPR
jgi:hypothetical protein